MNTFDVSIIMFFNKFSRVSLSFDSMVLFFEGNPFLKGGIIATTFWWFWFYRSNNNKCIIIRERIISTMASSFFTLVLSRMLAKILPFRLRPLHNQSLLFQLPYGVKAKTLESWSSFPSDHAAFLFALTTGIFFISKPTGIAILLYVIIFVCSPRVYLGLHYPTDIIFGALLGITISAIFNTKYLREYISKPFIHWLHKSAESFYACSFLFTFQIATMFEYTKSIFRAIYSLIFYH